MPIVTVYVVQSRDSGDFLYPSDTGDVGHTPYISETGLFVDRDEAIETALEEIGDNFIVYGFLKEIS
uniref:Uncharacterized protein n=1 Tax=Dulem virus 54 TaxID=3145765 RepID=A0AAU8B3G3_9VIRU